jgi:ABC-type lipoprotein release transport system permease subunit
MTAEKAAEIGRIRAAAGVKAVSRQDAEAELFGGGAEVVTGGRATSFDESRLIARQGPGRGAELFSRVHSQDEIDRGVALNAAVILDDPGRIPQAMAGIEQAARRAGIPKAKVVTWLEASGLVGQSMNLLRLVLYAAVLIIFAVALVIINNAMVMATLQRVKEIGTVRAIGAQRRFVLIMMLVETVATGLAFGALGAAAGLGIVKLIGVAGGIAARNDTMYFLFSGPALVPGIGAMSLAVSLSIVVGVSVLSALYPALIAMRVTPLEAMQSEE